MPLWQPNIKPGDWTLVDSIYDLPSDADLETMARDWVKRAPRGKRRNADTRFTHLFALRHVARTFQESMSTADEPTITILGSAKMGVAVGVPPANRRYPDMVLSEHRLNRCDYWVFVLYHGVDAAPEILGWISDLDAYGLPRSKAHYGALVVPHLKLGSIGRLLTKHDPTLPGAYGLETANSV